MNTSNVHSGLEDITVAATTISDVQGQVGRLIIKGHDVEKLAPQTTFEGVIALLWQGSLPTAKAEAEIGEELGKARLRAFRHVQRLAAVKAAEELGSVAMDFVRAAVASLPSTATKLDAVATVAVATTVWLARYQNRQVLEPSSALSHAEDVLRLLTGSKASPSAVRAFESYLVTVVDHGMNASTFAARVVASTGSDLVSAVAAGVGALKGPLHGGAPGPVLDMLDAIGAPENAEAWLTSELAAGRRIMGMGHRVYRVRDPRAAVLEKAIERLRESGSKATRLELARSVERAAESTLRRKYPDRDLHANVEFYTAVLLDAVGIPREVFTATFGIARTVGWCAHIEEQKETGRLIRPQSVYTGPQPSA